jgi:hypothetical protein
MTDEGRLRVLFHSDSREQCERKFDEYEEMFPNGIVDIYPRSIMLNAEMDD